jgi:hypothetical protein
VASRRKEENEERNTEKVETDILDKFEFVA